MTNERSLHSILKRILVDPLPTIIKRALARLKFVEDNKTNSLTSYWRRYY